MRHTVPGWVLACVTAAVATGALAGCSTSTNGEGTVASSSPSSSASAFPSRTATKTLTGVLLRAGDLPAGWTPTAHDSTGDNDSDRGLDKQLSRCIGVSLPPAAVESEAGAVHSPDFTDGDSEIGSGAKPARDVAAQKRFDRAVVASPKSDGCFGTALRKVFSSSLPSGSTVGPVTVHITGRSAGQPSDVQINFTADAQVTVQGKTIATELVLVDILTSKVDAELDFQGVGVPISAQTRAAAISAVAGRVAAY